MTCSTFGKNWTPIDSPQLPRRRDPSVIASSQQPVNENSDRIADCGVGSAYPRATYGLIGTFVSASNASPASILRPRNLYQSPSAERPHGRTAKDSKLKIASITRPTLSYSLASFAALRRASNGPSTPPLTKTHLRCGSARNLTIETGLRLIESKLRVQFIGQIEKPPTSSVRRQSGAKVIVAAPN